MPPGEPHEFGFLQMRPLVLSRETAELDVDDVDPTRELLCRSPKVLGNGRVDDLRDVVVVDFHRFDRAQSREAARAVARFNAELLARGAPYLLIGVGRWGSTDPWLGIPVTWDEISGARVIVEAGFRDFRVTPSQGSHFFQNLTSFQVGYFTVNPELGRGLRGLGLARRAAGRGRGRARAPAALRAAAGGEDERPAQRGRHLQAAVAVTRAPPPSTSQLSVPAGTNRSSNSTVLEHRKRGRGGKHAHRDDLRAVAVEQLASVGIPEHLVAAVVRHRPLATRAGEGAHVHVGAPRFVGCVREPPPVG